MLYLPFPKNSDLVPRFRHGHFNVGLTHQHLCTAFLSVVYTVWPILSAFWCWISETRKLFATSHATLCVLIAVTYRVIEAIPVGKRIAAAFFQSAAVRAAGFSFVPLNNLAPAVKYVSDRLFTICFSDGALPHRVLYVIMRKIPVLLSHIFDIPILTIRAFPPSNRIYLSVCPVVKSVCESY